MKWIDVIILEKNKFNVAPDHLFLMTFKKNILRFYFEGFKLNGFMLSHLRIFLMNNISTLK